MNPRFADIMPEPMMTTSGWSSEDIGEGGKMFFKEWIGNILALERGEGKLILLEYAEI